MCRALLDLRAAPMPMAPPSGMKNVGPAKGFLLKNPKFWLILWLQSVASWRCKIMLVMKGKYIMDGRACGLCLNNIAYCMLPVLELPESGGFQTLES